MSLANQLIQQMSCLYSVQYVLPLAMYLKFITADNPQLGDVELKMKKMRTGVIIGSAMAGAAAGALMTLNEREKRAIVEFFNDVKEKVVELAGTVKDKAVQVADQLPGRVKELTDKLPGKVKNALPESIGVMGGRAKESKTSRAKMTKPAKIDKVMATKSKRNTGGRTRSK